MGEQLASFAHEEEASAEQVAGSAHARGIDVGLGQGTGAEQHRDLVGVDAIVLGLTAVDGLHVEGMAEHERDAFAGAQIGEPVPAEGALGGDDEVAAVGRDSLEEELGVTPQIAMEKFVAALVIEDAEVHGASVQVDAAVVSMTAGVESHGSPPGLDEWVALSSFLPMLGRSRRGLHEYQAVAAVAANVAVRAIRLAAHGPGRHGGAQQNCEVVRLSPYEWL
jgi:hypothetical protein